MIASRTTLVALSLAALGAQHGCGGEPNGPALTVASSGSTVTTGAGGDPGVGGAGGADTTTTTTTTTTGVGGAGGMGEEPLHGCTSALAVDMTGGPAIVNLPAGPLCLKMSAGQSLTFTLDTPASHRYLGGTYDAATMVKIADANSPIVSCCDISPYTCCQATNDPITMSTPGAYPWYDDKNPVSYRGVVYVE